MDLVILVLGLALIGAAVWALTTYIPMNAIFRVAIYAVVTIAIVLYLVRRFGSSVPNVLP
jgi:hypothetical protein